MLKAVWAILGMASAIVLGVRVEVDAAQQGHIVFEAWYVDGSAANDLWIMAEDGSGLRQLTFDPADDKDPSFSPDGEQIAFVSNRTGQYEIFVMNVDGSGLTQVTADDDPAYAWKFDPIWAPDGLHIVYASSTEFGSNLFAIAPDGSDRGQLTFSDGHKFDLSWSPRGARIAFVESHGSDGVIVSMRANGKGQMQQLTDEAVYSAQPAWSPNGRQIAFITYAGGHPEILMMRSGGANPHQISSLQALGVAPDGLAWGS